MPASNTRAFEYFKKVAALNPEVVFRIVFDREQIKEEIIYLNTKKQLYEKGVNSNGEDIAQVRGRGYAFSTVVSKRAKGQPTDRVTLKDAGEFYRSWKVFVKRGSITIVADPFKEDTNLFEEWGIEILGLTDMSIEELKPLVIENYKNYIYGLLE